ncbi:non-ribosomal peptide synthetase [Thermothielavioides terrestris NRRL 8126]|uniref:Non-ribosomal peptide synthetase n=1 Tax=Thermothielavioides terrestris (strain ATCC 38088 / NRRL 8126) TaxID=578455 RepID=G2R6J4_THETT|nr:non-ribosomal peptide synthetase [Thermothielavioides terrestris NRRL 8126]AEO68475.1 non-ribosomal peptide synthetase [Thermothielavioides terrestris NRRL 8126]
MAAAPRPAGPQIDASTSWLLLEDETTEARLLGVVSQVLGISAEAVQLHQSFKDLGGDEQSAAALWRACMDAGMDVKVKDILRCSTLAELQSCITTCAPQNRNSVTDAVVEPVMVTPREVHRASRLSFVPSPKPGHSRTSSQASLPAHKGPKTDIEQALGTQPDIGRIATVRPKAGLLEGKLVALLSLATAQTTQENTGAINLVPHSHAFFAGTQIAHLKRVAATALPPEAVPDVWIALDGMPLTDSGDVDMRRLRTWVQNINESVHHQALSLEHQETIQAPATEMEKLLQRLVGKVLNVPQSQIGVNFSFTQLGGDEMTAMELAVRCKHESVYINPPEALGSMTLSELAAVAATRGGLAHKWDEETSDCFDLSPMQHLYFQTAMGGDLKRRPVLDGSYRFNQSLLLRLKKHFSFEDISAAIEAVVGHHAMLRARFGRGLNGWVQRVLPDVAGSYSLCHSTIGSDRELEEIIERTQISINVEIGPVFAVDYLSTNDGQQLLYLAAHHLVVDLPSWRTIIHDLDELLSNGSLMSQRSMPFHKWVDMQKADALSPDPRDLLPFALQPGDYAYWGLQDVPNTYGDALEVSFSLSQELTAILQSSCNQVFKTDSVDIYLAALMLSFAQTFHDRPVPTVWNQEHGRDPWTPDVDISETVGWFTSLCPVSLQVESSEDFITVLRHLKDRRRSIPARGTQYFASRFYHYDKEDLVARDWPFEIIFSYAGSLQHLERDNGVMEQLAIPGRTLASATSDIGANVGRIALFEISAMVDQGSAKVKFLYSRFSKDQARISQWVQNYEHLLLEAIGRLRYHPQELTLADVPHLDVTYEGLDKFNKDRLATLKLASIRDVETIYPVTAVQQSILISQAQRPDTCYLHAIYEFASPNGDPIDTSRICAAWEWVTMKHAALRTVFTESVSETGLWDMVILRRASPEMLFIDTAPAEDPVYELSNLPNLRPSESKPLHRLTVCKAPARTLVKLDISTALCDSLSIHLLLHDLRRAYATERAITEPDQFSYPHYLYFLKTVRQENSLAFWREKLAGVPPCLFPRLTVLPDELRFVNAGVDLDITSYQLSAFTRTQKTAVDAVLRLAWGLVLRCFTGSNHVCFGFQTVGRDESIPGMRHAVGSFSNTVACSYELATYTPVATALQMVEEQLLASLPHQHFTMAELQHGMGMKGGDRLFNSCLTFTEEPAGLNSKFTTRTSFELKPISLQQTFDVDIVINTRFAAGKLVVDIGQRLMSTEQSVNLANTFGMAIRAIMSSPNTSIGLVDLFSDRDYAQILAWDAESPSQAADQTQAVVHELISRQASIQPSSQAICSWDGSFTYLQLEEEATKLAHHLVDAGVGPHSVVPVVMDKCKLAPVAMVAVLKSGAAFVPIDSLELGMIQPIFERLNSRVVISSELAAPVLSNLFDQVVILNDELMNLLPQGQGPLTSMAAPSDRACILFVPTSSSEARGVTFSHAALSTAILGQGPAARITPLSRVMQLSSFNVDICVAEIFTTLVYGGCVCVPSAAERLQDFGAAVNRMQVNWSYMTPLLSRKLDPSLLPSLKVVCFRTRGLDEDTYSIWHGKVNVILAYGPQDVCPLGIAFLEALGPQHLRSIGRPFAGNLVIVNPEDHKKRMPIGAVGELVVEGPTLGFSYPNRESTMTPMSPLGPAAGSKARYFKTGHRARYTQGGLMEFISSKRDELDHDGKAVNVTEIEQYLRRCLGQGVDVVVESVIFRGQAKNDTLLTAFIELGDRFDAEENLTSLSVATKEQLAMAKQLAQVGLKNKFPPSLIPSAFVPVKHIPITPSLKVNRRRLQKIIAGLTKDDLLGLATVPNPNEAKFQHLKPLPLTQGEERMRAIWARVLGVEEAKISAYDTFFSVGGDEILAAQLVAACRHENISVSIADVVQNITLTELSRAIVTVDSPQITQDATLAPPTTSPSPVPLNANAIKEVFIERVIAPRLGVDGSAIADAAEASSTQIRYIETGMLSGRTNINYLVFNFSGAVDAKKLEEACRTLASIHPILRTAFVPYNRRVYQAVIKSNNVEFRRHSPPPWRLSATLDKVIKKDQTIPTKFETPMTKFMFLDGGKQSILILRLSKAQYDDLSVALLVKDLKRLYDGSQSPPRRPSFCDFMRTTMVANSHGAEEYWRALLEGAVMTQVVAHTHPYQMSTNVKTIRNPTIPLGSLSSLGISFETVLKGAWAMVLATLSASSDVVFGELIDGRHVRLPGGQSVAGVMGPTVNAIPVRVQFPDTALTPLSLLQYIHTQRVSGIPFENLGTLTIVEKSTPWAYWTRFSTLVQHQTEDTAINPSEPKSFHLGAAACKFTITESKAQDVPDLFVRSLVRPTNRVEISITFCADRVPETFAEHALRMLCSTISVLTSVTIMQPVVPSGSQYRAMVRRIPLPAKISSSDQNPESADWSTRTTLSKDQIKAVQKVISDTWSVILNPRALGVPESQTHQADFFDLWGSLIPAYQMMQQLNRELPKANLPGPSANLQVTMEEIIEHSTMLKQFELIASKFKPQPSKETQKSKDKEKEKDKEKGADKSSLSPKPPVQPHKKKPSMNVAVPAASLGSRIRRLASTVARTTPPPTNNNNAATSRQGANLQPPATPTTPVAIGIASAMVADLSPLSPKVVGSPSPGISGTLTPRAALSTSPGPIPSAPPQLPNLPAFEPIAEEAEPGMGTSTTGKTSATATASPAAEPDSMTEGSTASSTNASAEMMALAGMTLTSTLLSPLASAAVGGGAAAATRSEDKEADASRDTDLAGDDDSRDRETDRDTIGPLPTTAALQLKRTPHGCSANANVKAPATNAPVTPLTTSTTAAAPNTTTTTLLVRGEEGAAEDLVSPLSAVTLTSPKSAGTLPTPRSGGGGGGQYYQA